MGARPWQSFETRARCALLRMTARLRRRTPTPGTRPRFVMLQHNIDGAGKSFPAFEVVTCAASSLTSSVALLIAIEIPLVLNIARSFCMSPMVATAPVEIRRRSAIACTNVPLSQPGGVTSTQELCDRAAVACAPKCLLHCGLAASQQRCIGTGADEFAGARQIRREILNDGRIGLDGALFKRDIGAVVAAQRATPRR